MAITASAVIRIGASVLSNEKTRNILGWVLTAVFAPLILFVALIFGIGSGTAAHNNYAVQSSFYGKGFSGKIPAEYRDHVTDMQTAFARLDVAVSSANAYAAAGNSLDPQRVKAVFYALCFGEDAPSRREAARFTACFCRIVSYPVSVPVLDEEGNPTGPVDVVTVMTPLPLETAYENLAVEMGRTITEEEKDNAAHIYALVTAPSEDGSAVQFLAGGDSVLEIDPSIFTDPDTKNAADLAAYAVNAWESGWGYVWGTFGTVLTDDLFQYKLEQYPSEVGGYRDFIQTNWLGGRTTDCIGLIKGYGWLDADAMTIGYGTNGMPDIGANQMYYGAPVSGTIDTIPETPGLAVWCSGHIGVYIGNGEVIEAMGTKYGVVKTRLADRPWTHWLEVPYIKYD